MEGVTAAALVGIIIGFVILIVIMAFFNLSVQKAMKAVSEKNRKLNPGLIWLNFIPILNSIWTMYFCLTTCQSMNKDSGKRISPLQVIITMFILTGVNIILGIINGDYSYDFSSGASFKESFLNTSSEVGGLEILSGFLGLISFVLFIVFWVQIVKARKELEQMNRDGVVGGGADDILDQPL